MRTKYSILTERLAVLKEKAAKAEEYLEGLDMTDCGLSCGGCGEYLETEGDFARHFGVKQFDEMNNFLNLGYCPVEGPK